MFNFCEFFVTGENILQKQTVTTFTEWRFMLEKKLKIRYSKRV